MKIAHFSDLHLLDLEGVSPRRFLNKRLTGYANLRFKRKHVHHEHYVRAIARELRAYGIDHVAITGDVTNLALETEFALARRVLEEELHLTPDQVSLVPGNHDVYTRGALKTRRFGTYFARYLEGDLPEFAIDVGPGRFPYVRLRGPAAIIGLSSAVPRLPFVAAGHVGRKQLEALSRLLEHPEVKKRTLVLLLHHPVQNPKSRVKMLLEGLHDARALLERLADVHRGLVLHGHLHTRVQREHRTARGSLREIGATSASLHHHHGERMAGFNAYEICDDGSIGTVEAHVYDPAAERFVVESIPRVV